MRATISIKKEIQDRVEQRIEKKMFGRDEVKHEKVGEDISYCVYLNVNLTEVERQTILGYGLGEIVLEDKPTFDEDAIYKAEREGRERVEAIRGNSQAKFTERAMAEQNSELLKEHMKKARTTIRVADFFTDPYVQRFKTHYDAIGYAQLLKTKLLPRVKKLMEEVQSVPEEETFEV